MAGLAGRGRTGLNRDAGSHEDRRRALEAGFQGHLAKPVDGDRLVAALIGLLGHSVAGPRHGEQLALLFFEVWRKLCVDVVEHALHGKRTERLGLLDGLQDLVGELAAILLVERVGQALTPTARKSVSRAG